MPESPLSFQYNPTSSTTDEKATVVLSEQPKVNTIIEHTNASRSVTADDAISAMMQRGIDDPESLLEYAEPEAIVNACGWWDRKQGAKPGLLAWKIKQGGVQSNVTFTGVPSKRAQSRRIFEEFCAKHPVGSRMGSHRAWDERRWPGFPSVCSGHLLVESIEDSMVLVMVCDGCGFEACLTPRAMKGTGA